MSDTPQTPSDSSLQVEVLPTGASGTSDVQAIKAVIPDTGYVPLQDYLGMKTVDDDDKDKLQFIWDSFSKGRDRVETLEAIKEARNRLSEPEIGEKWLGKLYAYTRLIEEGRSIDKEKRVYESDDKLDNPRP